jgi:hypothetical protein
MHKNIRRYADLCEISGFHRCVDEVFAVGMQRQMVVFSDVSTQFIGPIFKGQAVVFDYFTLEDRIDRLPRNCSI